jgi:type IV secretory pathway VirJ component
VVNGSNAMRTAAAGSHATAVTAEGDLPMRIVSSLREPLTEGVTGKDVLMGLPIVEVSASPTHDLMAVIYSGDGGWRDLDKQVGEFLARQGVPVIGVDSLRYFWDEKTPDQTAADLSTILKRYASKWGTKRAILIGYSFGAGILPFAFNRLPEEDRRRVVEVSLLGLEPRAPFEIHVSAWFGRGVPGDALPVLPELRRIDLNRVQCFYGEEEPETLCREQELARAEVIRTAGGHHFDGDYPALARKILDGALRRVGEDS